VSAGDTPVTKRAVVEWLARYIDVWKSGDHSRVAELFTADAVYHADPFAAPRHGHAAIAEYWRLTGDPADTFEAHYDPFVVAGDLAIVTGFSRYFDESRSRVDKEYGNIVVLRFAGDGRCSEYREWYMLREGGAADEVDPPT
jgi:ketosteroid isomerase-like protein